MNNVDAFAGMEFGNLIFGGNVSIVSTGIHAHICLLILDDNYCFDDNSCFDMLSLLWARF